MNTEQPVHPTYGTGRSRSQLFIWAKRLILGFIIILVALVVAGTVYQAVGAQSDRRNFPPPGQLVDVGGYRLHIYCTGVQNSGNPTVILETLSGGASAYWGWVQPEVAKVTQVCSYDRAGRAWSELSTQPASLQQTVNDLHTLLQNAGVPGPYELVGHSIGGIYVRKFAAQYPNEVVGVALIDAAHPDQFDRLEGMRAERDAYLLQSALFPVLARLGLFRFYFATGGEIDFKDLPVRQHDEVAAFWSSPEYFNSQRAESIASEVIYSDGQSLGSLGDLPLAVVSQGNNPPPGWSELQTELADLSPNKIFITIPDATHASLVFNEQHADQVSEAILHVVEAARTGLPLASE